MLLYPSGKDFTEKKLQNHIKYTKLVLLGVSSQNTN
jgi:hypothetical protein